MGVYKGLQRYTRVYRGMEGFMGGIQGFNVVYKGLWGVQGIQGCLPYLTKVSRKQHVHSYAAFSCCMHL